MMKSMTFSMLLIMLTMLPTMALAQPSQTRSTSSSDTTVTLTGDELAQVVERACAAARKKAALVPTLQASIDDVQRQRDIESGRVIELRQRVMDYDALVRESERQRIEIESRWPQWVTWVAVPVGIALGVGVGFVL